jgi:hypothetical protein
MRSDIVPGGIFPNYELLDHTGTLRKLGELQGDDPLILTLARGHYCPGFWKRIAFACARRSEIRGVHRRYAR